MDLKLQENCIKKKWKIRKQNIRDHYKNWENYQWKRLRSVKDCIRKRLSYKRKGNNACVEGKYLEITWTPKEPDTIRKLRDLEANALRKGIVIRKIFNFHLSPKREVWNAIKIDKARIWSIVEIFKRDAWILEKILKWRIWIEN